MSFVGWMYVADLVGSISVVFTLACIVCLIGYGAMGIYAGMEDKPRPKPTLVKYAAILALIACVVPSQKTVYVIAAMKAGKDAAATPTGQKALKALDVWLDKQIAGEPKE